MGQHQMTDCSECGVPQISVWPCDFCGEGTCDSCYQEWKQCPECSRRGSPEHFDGMYCQECRESVEEVSDDDKIGFYIEDGHLIGGQNEAETN